jgi:hypothetical protein
MWPAIILGVTTVAASVVSLFAPSWQERVGKYVIDKLTYTFGDWVNRFMDAIFSFFATHLPKINASLHGGFLVSVFISLALFTGVVLLLAKLAESARQITNLHLRYFIQVVVYFVIFLIIGLVLIFAQQLGAFLPPVWPPIVGICLNNALPILFLIPLQVLFAYSYLHSPRTLQDPSMLLFIGMLFLSFITSPVLLIAYAGILLRLGGCRNLYIWGAFGILCVAIFLPGSFGNAPICLEYLQDPYFQLLDESTGLIYREYTANCHHLQSASIPRIKAGQLANELPTRWRTLDIRFNICTGHVYLHCSCIGNINISLATQESFGEKERGVGCQQGCKEFYQKSFQEVVLSHIDMGIHVGAGNNVDHSPCYSGHVIVSGHYYASPSQPNIFFGLFLLVCCFFGLYMLGDG